MRARLSTAVLAVAMGAFFAGCASTPNVGTASDRDLLHTRAEQARADLLNKDPSLQHFFDSAYGYVIFPHVVTGAVGVGAGHGNGEVYQNGHLVGYADISQASVGAQLGGEKYAEAIFFETQASFDNFRNNALEFDARATAVAASDGAAATANYSRGVLTEALPEGGLMAQASIGGQKFRYEPLTQGEANER